MKWKFGEPPSMFSSDNVKKRWPSLLIDFSESNLMFFCNFNDVNKDYPEEDLSAVGDPVKIVCESFN